MKRTVALLVLVVMASTAIPAEERVGKIMLSIEEIAVRARTGNLEIVKANRAVRDAERELKGEPNIKSSSFSLGGGYTDEWYGSAGVDLPIMSQMSVGGEVSLDERGRAKEEISLSVSPFAPSRKTYTEQKTYKQASVHRRYLSQRIYFEAEQAALNLLLGDMERKLAQAVLELERDKYELELRRQDLGEASFQDVQDQQVDLIAARRDLYNSEQGFLQDWKALQLLIFPSEQMIDVEPLSLDSLLFAVKQRKDFIAGMHRLQPSSEELETLQLDLTALQAELKATHLWRPELSISAAVGLPDPSYSLNFNLTFSPSELQDDKREELKADIEMKRVDIATERYSLALERQLIEQSIEIAEQALASSEIQMQRDSVALQEGLLLFEQGQRTTLEIEQMRLNTQRSAIESYRAAVELYRVLAEFLLLFVPPDNLK